MSTPMTALHSPLVETGLASLAFGAAAAAAPWLCGFGAPAAGSAGARRTSHMPSTAKE